MYVSVLGGVIAALALWNLLTGNETPHPGALHVLVVGGFPATGAAAQEGPGAGERLRAGLVERLSAYPALELRPGGAGSSPPAGSDPPAPDFLLDGALEAGPDGWLLSARLRDANEPRTLWSESLAVPSGDLDRAAARIAGAVSRTLKISPVEKED
jgi:hypothetical protein